MSVLAQIFAADGDVSNLRDPALWLLDAFGSKPNAAGVRVTTSSALSLSTYFACQRVIAEDTAKLPLITYKRLDRGKERAPDHFAYKLLHDAPNPNMTSMAFRETLTHHALGWGNGYAEIVRDGGGRPRELWPLHPSRVDRVRTDSNELIYRVWQDSGAPIFITQDRMFHLHGLGFDGVFGYSVAKVAADSLGVAIATQQFGGKFFSNGANVSGVYETPNKLSDKALEHLRQSLQTVHAGVENALKTMILEEGLKFSKTTIPPNDAQFLETRQFQVEELCRWHRVAPHKVQHLLRATFSNIEHQSIEHVGDTLMPWEVRWEQESQRKIIRDDQYFAEHLNDALLRGDTASRYEAHNKAIMGGWKNRNEIRQSENLNTVDGLDEFLDPVAIAKAPDEKKPEDKPNRNEPEPKKPKKERKEDSVEISRKAFARIFADTAQRLLNKEQNAAARAEKKHGLTPALTEWAQEFMEEHRGDVIAALLVPAEAFVEQDSGAPLTQELAAWTLKAIEAYADEHTQASISVIAAGQTAQPGRAPEISNLMIERLSQWQ